MNTANQLNTEPTATGDALGRAIHKGMPGASHEPDNQDLRGSSAEGIAADDVAYQAVAERESHCPKCSAEHRPTKILGVDATECALCHGIFFSEEHAKAIQDLSAGQASS